tara:strand:- start:1198 stop:1866 length:669 start_codon:yes stop_codon:yes gene_type:complete
MTEEQKLKLERPFEPKLVRKRRGPGGKELSYVPVTDYIGRLNECFGSGWSFEITAREQYENQVVVEGRLIADGVIKAGIGGADLRRNRDGEMTSLADAMKTASSDALKRCCRLWGIGLALYVEEENEAAPPPNQAPTSVFGASKPRNEEQGRVTRAQLDKLRQLVAELGAEWASFRHWVKKEHNVALEYASRSLASEIIGELIHKAQARRGNGHASQPGALQ